MEKYLIINKGNDGWGGPLKIRIEKKIKRLPISLADFVLPSSTGWLI